MYVEKLIVQCQNRQGGEFAINYNTSQEASDSLDNKIPDLSLSPDQGDSVNLLSRLFYMFSTVGFQSEYIAMS